MKWLLAVMLISSTAQAEPLRDHIPQAMVAAQATMFREDMAKGGMQAVIAETRRCYQTFAAAHNRLGLSACLLYDIAAERLDSQMATSMDYLEPSVFDARASRVARLLFGPDVDRATIMEYYGSAPTQILESLR